MSILPAAMAKEAFHCRRTKKFDTLRGFKRDHLADMKRPLNVRAQRAA